MTETGDEPVLCVDFGTSTTQAALLSGGRVLLLHDPAGGTANWPSVALADGSGLLFGAAAERRKRTRPRLYRPEFKRDLGRDAPIRLGEAEYTAAQLLTGLLRALRGEAERLAGRPVRDALMTFPASYGVTDPRRAVLLAAAAEAGFDSVELLPEPVAAALAPPAGPPFGPGDLVLVYDFGGGTFDTALVRVREPEYEVLGHSALDDCGGRDLDAEVLESVLRRVPGRPGAADPDAAQRAWLDLADLSVDLKEQLSSGDTAEGFTRDDVPVTLDRSELAGKAGRLLARTVYCCEDLLEASGTRREELSAVLMVGGSTRSPVVADFLRDAFPVPVRQAEDAQHAVVRGACAWAGGGPGRVLRPRRPPAGARPLSWDLPGGEATLVDTLVAKGTPYEAGAPLARVRTAEGTLYRLLADAPGTVATWHAEPGTALFSGDWLVTAVNAGASGAAGFPGASGQHAPARLAAEPAKTVWTVADASVGALAFSSKGMYLATGDDAGTAAVWRLTDGQRTFAAEHDSPVTALAFDGTSRLARGTRNGRVAVADHTLGRTAFSTEREREVRGLAFSASGALLAARTADRTADRTAARTAAGTAAGTAADSTVWRTDGWTEVETGALPPEDPWDSALPGDGAAGPPGDAAVLARLRAAAGGSGEDLAAVYDLLLGPDAAPRVLFDSSAVLVLGDRAGGVLRLPARNVRLAAISRPGRLIATAPAEGDGITLWSLDSGEAVRTLSLAGGIAALALSRDGTRLAAAGHSGKGEVAVWTLTEVAPFPVHARAQRPAPRAAPGSPPEPPHEPGRPRAEPPPRRPRPAPPRPRPNGRAGGGSVKR
ncbi:Hsp70 family protein [Streptomyces sp. DSM 44917]|uniref:Hsp70 family protein n=1 Tax=Streptomyces boetiae TaxID=3075541 RepID=A0ABU2L966_9ACTN|nr:Hsp70 family protein [Streptomyces sp. DSM 44917]MDT0308021.1 Hsp70 family protein [Streptomyces sp. DSM 44917]